MLPSPSWGSPGRPSPRRRSPRSRRPPCCRSASRWAGPCRWRCRWCGCCPGRPRRWCNRRPGRCRCSPGCPCGLRRSPVLNRRCCRCRYAGGLRRLRVVEDMNSSRNSSPTPRPLGTRLQLKGTSVTPLWSAATRGSGSTSVVAGMNASATLEPWLFSSPRRALTW